MPLACGEKFSPVVFGAGGRYFLLFQYSNTPTLQYSGTSGTGGDPGNKMKKEKTQMPAEHSEPRRSFLTKLWFGLGAVVFAEIVYLVTSFLRPRRSTAREGEFGTVIDAGAVGSFERGSVTAFPRGRFYLARLEDGGFLALSRQCTHLGCTLPWNEAEQKFLCPCHSSAFDIRGSVVRAPAPRALDIFRIVIENNVVMVNTGKRIQRSEFRRDQETYPA